MATPLLWHWHDQTRSFSLALPVAYHAAGPDRLDFGLVPLFCFARRERATTWLSPLLLLGHSSDPDNHSATTIAGPFYAAKRDRTFYAGMVPLIFARKDPDSFRLTIFPLFHLTKTQDHLLVMATPLL